MTFSRSGYAWWCAITVLISAFLLFQVQPLISKMILPWFGGGPGVWTTCMLFFQIVLLLGYGYAHFLFRLQNMTLATVIHCVLLSIAVLLLPISPQDHWKPSGSDEPTFKILTLLAAKVGLPYFLLSSTGPLIQAWFARVAYGTSPYRLYALSNVGSLAGLLTYPFVFEPAFTTVGQGHLWSGAFVLFVLCCGGLALTTSRLPPAFAAPSPGGAATTKSDEPRSIRPVFETTAGSALPTESERRSPQELDAARLAADEPPLLQRVLWLILPALGSVMLLAVTHHVCQDVAVTPFFWVAPLSLYLLTFIICFDSESWYLRRTFAALAGFVIVGLSIVMLNTPINDLLEKTARRWEASPRLSGAVSWLQATNQSIDSRFDKLEVEAGSYLLLLFLVCMVCHGELVRRKPAPRHLTKFYIMTSAGGALGGILVGLVCPNVLPDTYELNLGLLLSFVVVATVLVESTAERNWGWIMTLSAWMVIFAGMLFVVRGQFQAVRTGNLATARNFYGVLRVAEYGTEEDGGYRALYNGRILHGLQPLDRLARRQPNSYYDVESGIGVIMRRYTSTGPTRLAVVGLGTGTMATFIQRGDFIRFYEINPIVKEIAEKYFHYLEDCPGTVEIQLGDARLEMERELQRGSNEFDVIVLDAFSGDAIPAHLLTKEAFEIYFGHLKPDGVLAVHISNRHLELTPVVDGLANHFQYSVFKIENDEGPENTDAASDWMLVTRNEDLLNDPVVVQKMGEYKDRMRSIPLWTDQYSNLLDILRSRYKDLD